MTTKISITRHDPIIEPKDQNDLFRNITAIGTEEMREELEKALIEAQQILPTTSISWSEYWIIINKLLLKHYSKINCMSLDTIFNNDDGSRRFTRQG